MPVSAEMAASDATMPFAPNLNDIARLIGRSLQSRWRNDCRIGYWRKRKKAAGNHASSQHTLEHWGPPLAGLYSPPQREVNHVIRMANLSPTNGFC